MKKKLLWCGDAGCPSGFARATHGVLDTLRQTYDVTVLGINYRGDPHDYPYPIYAAAVEGDVLGVQRLIWLCDVCQPDVIVLQNDFWNIPYYTKKLKKFPEYANVPIVGFIAVDGKNVKGETLNDLSLAIFWTKFAEAEAIKGGCTVPTAVVPLGVDLNVYKPIDKHEARAAFPFSKKVNPDDLFLVGNCNRNQPRKRMDLLVRYFASWVRSQQVDNAILIVHVAPTGDQGFDVDHLAKYYGIQDRIVIISPEVHYGIPEMMLRNNYSMLDAFLTPTQGEGFGLTTFEAMACGTPVVAPDWSALGELCKDAALLIPCTSTAATIGSSVIGGVPDEQLTVDALDLLYHDPDLCRSLSEQGLKRVSEDRFRWENVGAAFRDVLDTVRVPEVAVA